MHSKEEVQKAKKKVKSKKEFYQHLMAFVIINFFLFTLNMITSAENPWFQFPLLGWGVGLAFHYVEVFGIPGFNILSREWEDQEMEAELKRMKEEERRNATRPVAKEKEEEKMELKELRKNYDESEFV